LKSRQNDSIKQSTNSKYILLYLFIFSISFKVFLNQTGIQHKAIIFKKYNRNLIWVISGEFSTES